MRGLDQGQSPWRNPAAELSWESRVRQAKLERRQVDDRALALASAVISLHVFGHVSLWSQFPVLLTGRWAGEPRPPPCTPQN